MRGQRLTLIFLFLFNSFAFAQEKEAKPAKKSLDVSRALSISYGSPSWNTDSTKIDTAYLILKDKASGKIVRIQLEETEPDSSNFVGQFSVNLGDSEKITPEIYVPPQELRNSERDYKKLHAMIENGHLARKPVIWKKNPHGQSMLDVYDTREQAEAALKNFQEQEKLSKELKKKKQIVQPENQQDKSEAAVQAAKQAEYAAQLNKLALEASQREAERIRLEQIEKQKAEQRLKEAAALSQKQKAEREAKARALADEAMEFYKRGDYAEAEPKFKESVDLDPENKSYYFKYGVTLYRNQKFNEALVVFKLAQTSGREDVEKNYYTALTHYRLAELDQAHDRFKIVAESKDPVLAASALFYMGVVRFSQAKYSEAKKYFETVIDTSNDPKLDQQAEDYLDRIAYAIQLQKIRENKFTLSGLLGVEYDSNILLTGDNPNSSIGPASKVGSLRLLTVADLEYRAVYTDRHEFSVKGDANLTNSKNDDAFPGDAWVYTLSAPYTFKGTAFNKGYQLTITPSYARTYMAPNKEATKYDILDSAILDIDNTFMMSRYWFSIYSFEFRNDDSGLHGSIGPDNSDAKQYTIRTQQGFYLDPGRKQVLIGNLSFTDNAAVGEYIKYTRFDVGANYFRPWKWDTTWNLGIQLYQLHYPEIGTGSRNDTDTALTTGLSKPIRNWVTWGVSGTFTQNTSDESAYQYSKYVIMTTATFNTNF